MIINNHENLNISVDLFNNDPDNILITEKYQKESKRITDDCLRWLRRNRNALKTGNYKLEILGVESIKTINYTDIYARDNNYNYILSIIDDGFYLLQTESIPILHYHPKYPLTIDIDLNNIKDFKCDAFSYGRFNKDFFLRNIK